MTLLSSVLSKPNHELAALGNPESLIEMFRNVHMNTLQFESRMIKKGETSFQAAINLEKISIIDFDEETFPDHLDESDYYILASHCAANIQLMSLQQAIPFSSTVNQRWVNCLRKAMTRLKDDIWIRMNGEIYAWMCFTGAASAQKGKNWFIAKAGPVVMSLDADSVSLFKSGAVRFCRILRHLDEMDPRKYNNISD